VRRHALHTANRAIGRRLESAALQLAPAGVRRRALVRRMNVDEGVLDTVVFKPAETRRERQGAFRVLHDAYVGKRLIDPLPGEIYVPPFALMPDSTLLVALHDGIVVATLTLVEDSPLGLPMERLYPTEVQAVRRPGRRLAEVSAAAVSRGQQGRGVALMLYALLVRWAHLHREIDDLVFAAHPRFARLFTDVLRFAPLGGTRAYDGLNRAPAVALWLDLAAIESVARRSYRGLRPPGLPRDVDLYELLLGQGHPSLRLPARDGPARSAPPRWDAGEWSSFARHATYHGSAPGRPAAVAA
jgi:hypothetical protein